MASGVVPGPKVAKADSGTMVSVLVTIEAPVEVPPRPLVRALSWAFSADCAWMVEASGAADVEAVVPAARVSALLLMALLLAAVELTEAVAWIAGAVAAAAAVAVTVPDTALVDWVPLTAPAEVLT